MSADASGEASMQDEDIWDVTDWVLWLEDVTMEQEGWWHAVGDALLRRDAWCWGPSQSALRRAVAAGDLVGMAEYLRGGCDPIGCGVIHMAACAHEEAVIELLTCGVSVDEVLPGAPWSRLALCRPRGGFDAEWQQQCDGESGFDALGGSAAVHQRLQEALARASPLHCAALCGHATNVHLLLAAGAQPDRPNAQGASAAQLAERFRPLHAPEATDEILAALGARSVPQSVVVYSHVVMRLQNQHRVAGPPGQAPGRSAQADGLSTDHPLDSLEEESAEASPRRSSEARRNSSPLQRASIAEGEPGAEAGGEAGGEASVSEGSASWLANPVRDWSSGSAEQELIDYELSVTRR